jgi:ribonuclease HI
MKLRIFTDGACSNNPGPGGWASILNMSHGSKVLKGYEVNTTNNRMELMAVVKTLEKLLIKNFYSCDVIEINSDSAYVVNAFLQNWILGWIKNGWKNSNKEDVKNKELWHELISLTKVHNVTFHKVKGHADNEYNNRCDELARNAIKNL